jgi:hypothetical protein
MKPNTLIRRDTKLKFMLQNIIKNSCRVRNTQESRIRIRKKSCRIPNTGMREVLLLLKVFLSDLFRNQVPNRNNI